MADYLKKKPIKSNDEILRMTKNPSKKLLFDIIKGKCLIRKDRIQRLLIEAEENVMRGRGGKLRIMRMCNIKK